MKKTILLVGILFGMYSQSAVATTPGGQAGGFLRMGLGARAIAMGNAFTGLARDGFAGYYNPASLPFMDHSELSFSFGNLSLDRKHNFIGFSTYIQPGAKDTLNDLMRAGFAFGIINAGVGNIDGRDRNGRHTGMFSNTENAVYFSFAMKPLPFLALGFSAKVVNSRFPTLLTNDKTLSASGFGLDFGLYARPLQKLSLGVVIKDIKTKYTWNTEGLWDKASTTINYFPTFLRMGAAYQLPFRSTVTADAEFNEEQGWRFYFGGEVPYRNLLVVRGGYNSDRLTFGFGVLFKLWKYRGELSYAYDSISITPAAEQYFSWRILF